MYNFFIREHRIELRENPSRPENYDVVIRDPGKKECGLLVRYLDQVKKTPRKVLILGNVESIYDRFHESLKNITAGGGAVFNEKGQILLIKRLGYWDLPKGKMEKDEDKSIRNTAIREVEEECNLHDVKIVSDLIDTYHIYEYKDRFAIKRTVWFKMFCYDHAMAAPQVEEQIEAVKWMDFDNLVIDMLHTYPAIREVLRAL